MQFGDYQPGSTAMFIRVFLLLTLTIYSALAFPATEKAIFAGGCFWCMEPPFDKLEGVITTVSGYTGGHKENPGYYEVSAGGTGHFEAVEVTYDPEKVSYETLLRTFWTNIDPLNNKGQFCDRGSQYLTAIFYLNDAQETAAQHSKQALVDSNLFDKPIATRILPADKFYPAEEYHQDYYTKNPLKYHYYRNGCGRDVRLKQLWKNVELPF
ncbi:MAG: peptide-methionine (S)-S-oxide reductase [Gammaproteobacteria bacterium]|nr:MAG: peptide-methionine (S)-S-oxide reductase [Gammaproteobacteria bacterium]